MKMPVKLLMTWDIRAGLEETYFTFITQEFPVVLQRANLQLTDAWYTVYGNWPQVRMAFMCEDITILQTFIISAPWLNIKRKLLTYILDYQQKIIPARGGFQI